MPYSKEFRKANPELVKKRQAAAAAKYASAHPERVKKQKQEWHEKNRARSIARTARWREDNPEGAFNARLKRTYGWSRELFDKKLAEQNGVCAICKGPPTGRVRNGEALRLSVDHDHSTDRVRGLLCHYCNVMLGYGRDSVAILEQGISYLKRYSEK